MHVGRLEHQAAGRHHRPRHCQDVRLGHGPAQVNALLRGDDQRLRGDPPQGVLQDVDDLVVPVGGGGHHEDFTVQQLETGVNCLDQPGQVGRREATGRRRWQQDHLPVDRPLGWQRFNGGHVNRVHPRPQTDRS
jgi:hypothetical protein